MYYVEKRDHEQISDDTLELVTVDSFIQPANQTLNGRLKYGADSQKS